MHRASSFFFVGVLVLGACGDDEPEEVDVGTGGTTRTVACNGKTCRADEYCCGSDGWADATCAPSCEDKNPIFCDDASDCQPGSDCCFILKDGNSIVSSQCATTCPIQSDRGQLCNTQTGDCLDGTCTPMPIAPSGLSQCVKN
ncbi:MAG: hypothetical protein KIT84_00055 [Labilithrix sp.]|nr:hypothetical protein [Labilithrix sp.]MCW5809374.1 hypothetical protein [Labilithrix sp.]